MDTTPIPKTAWPYDLDPATVPFKGRTVTVLQRLGFWVDWTLFDTLSEADVLDWWNAGPVTVEDLRVTGNAAIERHRTETGLLMQLEADLSEMASEPWAPHVWRRDPRFAQYVPEGDHTVYEIATSGSAVDCRVLWEHGEELRDAVEAQARLSFLDAISQYVEAISGQHGERLDVLLARTGLNGCDPITGTEAARRLSMSHQRFYKIAQQLHRARDRACPPAGIWMPQVDDAERTGWPEDISPGGKAEIRAFFPGGPPDREPVLRQP